MSCNSLLYSNDGENAVGRCDDKTRSCILSSQNMTLSLSINTLIDENIKICESYSGLQCVDNETLVACPGDAKSTHYTVSCNGVAIPNAGSFLQGHCYKNSCLFAIIHQTNSSDTQADQSENYASYRFPPPNADSSISELLYSNTNLREIHEEPEILIHQVEVFDLYDEYDALKYSLSRAEHEYFVDNHNSSKIHTRNSSSGGDTALTAGAAEETLQSAQDDLSQTDNDVTLDEGILANAGEPDLHLELVPSHFGNICELTNPAGIEIHSRTSSLLNLDHISVASETKLKTETGDSKTSASVSPTRLSISGTTLIETSTQVTESIPTGTISFSHETKRSTSKSIPRETTSMLPQNIPTETTTAISKF
jgi:hypothetical protein